MPGQKRGRIFARMSRPSTFLRAIGGKDVNGGQAQSMTTVVSTSAADEASIANEMSAIVSNS
jgi:hypothetical protein